MKRIVVLFFLLVGVGLSAQTKAKFFGEKFTINKPNEMGELITQLKTTDELKSIQVVGEVIEVCQKKGCWMKLKSADGKEMHVVFKDYAFFVPKDLAGKRVVLNGIASINFTAVEELRHYAEDAGKSKEEIAKITEPKREPRFEATGVAVY